MIMDAAMYKFKYMGNLYRNMRNVGEMTGFRLTSGIHKKALESVGEL
jgi:hypothetical protein